MSIPSNITWEGYFINYTDFMKAVDMRGDFFTGASASGRNRRPEAPRNVFNEGDDRRILKFSMASREIIVTSDPVSANPSAFWPLTCKLIIGRP